MLLEKLSLFILLILLGITVNKKESFERTQFFPRIEEKVKKLPEKHNLWIFILAGQSNMAGRGFVEAQDTVPCERIFTINSDSEIILAKEPLHFYEPTRKGLDCGLSFAKTLIQYIPDSISILLVPTAVGGSSTLQWIGDSIMSGVQLLTNFKEKVEFCSEFGVIKGILWHQGESDAKYNNIDYSKRLSLLFTRFRQIVDNPKIPIYIGELGKYYDKNRYNWPKINNKIRCYSSQDSYSFIVKTDDLNDLGDKIHFNSEGQRIMGQRFAIKVIESYDDNFFNKQDNLESN